MIHPYQYGGMIDAALLTPEEDALYLRLAGLKDSTPDFDGLLNPADSLRTIAERLDCDTAVRRIGSRLECRAGYGDRRYTDLHCVAACVTLYWGDGQHACVNSAAAERIADRLDSGLAPDQAIERTLLQCERHTPTEGELLRLEKDADTWTRTLSRLDSLHKDDLGSDAHRAAISAADLTQRAG